MALQPPAVTPVALGISVSLLVAAWRSLTAATRVMWGLTVGLLFLLAFPLAILFAPLLWALAKLWGGSDESQAEADFP